MSEARVRELIELSRSDPNIRANFRAGSLRYATHALSQLDADADTKYAFELTAYRLGIRAWVELHGVPDAVEDFESCLL